MHLPSNPEDIPDQYYSNAEFSALPNAHQNALLKKHDACKSQKGNKSMKDKAGKAALKRKFEEMSRTIAELSKKVKAQEGDTSDDETSADESKSNRNNPALQRKGKK